MSPPERPAVECERHHTGLPVPDVMMAVEFYTEKLGFELGFTWGDPVEMAGVTLGDVQVFLQTGTPAPEGCTLYFVVDDADALFEFQRANGVEVVYPPGDREYELRDYRVGDLHGYQLVFGHYIYTVGPPVPIERAEMTVRLEKRLAALVEELAEHKGMSVGSFFEETLLHTFEPLADGVASPHTKGQLRLIRELKEKHGIDYDCHASYRFVEE